MLFTTAVRKWNNIRANRAEGFVCSSRSSRFSWLILCNVLTALMIFSAPAQIQQAWVAHYNNGIANGTNQVVKIALDSNGNIYVTGFSQNTNSNLGYVTIKYAPNANQLWAARYDSTNHPSAMPVGLVLGNSNNVFVTGNALTVKYDANGNQLWTAPYAGTSLAVDTNENSVVTGISTSFGTVKLNPNGSNLWVATYPSSYGLALGQQVLIASDGSVYVAGSYTYICQEGMCYLEMLATKYNANGNQLWFANSFQADVFSVQVEAVTLDGVNNFYVVTSFGSDFNVSVSKYATDGSLVWLAGPDYSVNSRFPGLVLDSQTNVLVTGKDGNDYPDFYYGTYKINTNGSTLWSNYYPQPPVGVSVATSVAVDSANNSYVTGYSPGTNSENDIVTMKYGPNGNQLWLQRYSSPGNGNAAGNAIAVDSNGNVYVAGYDTTTAGGTEMVLIKYSPVTLQRKPDGTVLLETQGSPGESYDIQASVDLLNWMDLGNVLADTNGLMQFDDTNAPNYNARFYYTNPQ